MQKIQISITTHPHFQGLEIPKYQTEGSSGIDLLAACDEPVELKPGERKLIPTGLSIAMPKGIEAQVRPRSGLAIKHGITMLNTPGTIDSDYRGEIKVIVVNLGQESYTIERGMRVAQMIFAPVLKADLVVVDNLEETLRGSGGFGHTGV